MPSFDFESQKHRHSPRWGDLNSRSFKVALGFGLASVLTLGYTFASSINLISPSGSRVEFGQGVLMATACDSSVTVTLNSNFVNSTRGGEFKLSSVTLSNIDTSSCSGKGFKIKIYDNSNQINFFGSTKNIVLQSTTSSITYNILNPDQSVDHVKRITIESISGIAGEVFYNSENGHYYSYINANVTWNQAFNTITGSSIDGIVGGNPGTPSGTINMGRSLENCYYKFAGMCGYFVTVTSPSENDFVKDHIPADAWLGGTNRGNLRPCIPSPTSCDGWYWADDRAPEYQGPSFTITYANWAGGEPNNSSNYESAMQFYHGNKFWNDLPENNLLWAATMGYVVEYGNSSIDSVDSETLYIYE